MHDNDIDYYWGESDKPGALFIPPQRKQLLAEIHECRQKLAGERDSLEDLQESLIPHLKKSFEETWKQNREALLNGSGSLQLGFLQQLSFDGLREQTYKRKTGEKLAIDDAALKECVDKPVFLIIRRLVRLLQDYRSRVYYDGLEFVKKELEEQKSREGFMTFNDLLNELEQRLRDPQRGPLLKQVIRQQFPFALVDEFQDTDGVQFNIFHSIFADASALEASGFFLIGDPKQSIYRFRGADVHVFNQTIADNPGDVVELTTTRRTSPALGSFFNEFFPALLDPVSLGRPDDSARIEWTSDVVCSRSSNIFPGRAVDLMLRCGAAPWAVDCDCDPVAVVGAVADADPGEAASEGIALDEPAALARRIRNLLDHVKVQDNRGNSRNLTPADFAVLLRSWTHAEEFRRALEDEGIPAELAGGRGLLNTPEVTDLINLIRFFANRNDPLAAAGVLRGACFGMSDLGLYVLAKWPGVKRWRLDQDKWLAEPWEDTDGLNGPFKYPRNLQQVATSGCLDAEAAVGALVEAGVLQETRAGDVLAQLRRDAESLCVIDADGTPVMDRGAMLLADLVDRSGYLTPSRLLEEAIIGFRLEAVWMASPAGRRAVANAWKFVDLVRGVEVGGTGLQGIVAWIDSSSDPTPEGLISGVSNAVRISTIHGAKGLEWPVVAVAGLGYGFHGGSDGSWESNEVPNLDRTVAPSPVPRINVSAGGFCHDADSLKKACDALLVPEDAAEEKRLLYVAMTRARDHLILSGNWAEKPDVVDVDGNPSLWKCSSHKEFISSLFNLKNDKNKANWIPQAAWVKDHVNVVTVLGTGAETEVATQAVGAPLPDAPVPACDLAWGTDGLDRESVNPSTARFRVADIDFSQPGDMQLLVKVPDGVDDRDTGTMFHALMEHWNFRFDLGTAEDIFTADYLRAFAARFDNTPGVDHAPWLRRCIELIAADPLYPELRNAAGNGRLFHEVQLSSLLPPGKSFPGGLDVSGRIDLLFQDESGCWCVLDYKETRKVTTPEELSGLARSYGPQLALYRAVLESWRPGQVGRLGLWLVLAGKVWWVEG